MGKAPPGKGIDAVKVDYKTGGGTKGNLPAQAINKLKNSIAFVNAVMNPEPSGGGGEMESVGQALERGPHYIVHRGRAIAANDFEWLAKEAYPNIAKVKCLPNMNARMEREYGCVTLVVVTQGGLGDALYFHEMKRKLEAYLLERAASVIAFPEYIQVIQPAYLEVSVIARLAVERMDDALAAETAAVEKLERFLDPIRGQTDGNGWEIGAVIHESFFYGLLKAVPHVRYVEDVTMSVVKIEAGERTPLNAGALPALAHGLVVSGKHRVIAIVS
nr:baseplate J/gp47 family protein [Paenibacillus hamazuiensis]